MRMKSKVTIIITMALLIIASASFIGFSIWHSKSNTPEFESGGYILQGDATDLKQIDFASGGTYMPTLSGEVEVKGADGEDYTVEEKSFVHLEDGSTMAFSDAALLNFEDLTENFINHYYIEAGLKVSKTGEGYVAQTDAGSMEFGEHLMKLDENRYIIQSPSLKVDMGTGEDVRDVNDFVQVYISEDKIIYLMTPENVWMTISDQCFIETEGGVKIFPVSQIVESGKYKLSIAKLSVSTEDAIVLTEDETRRQIVPELNFTAVDGKDGDNGKSGKDGQAGTGGTSGAEGEGGRTGDSGQIGATGTTGEAGAEGDIGDKGSTGSTGNTGSAGADALVSSSTNTALPVMNITNWKVTSTGLAGTISITDNSGMLEAVSQEGYAGTITITDVNTGEVVYCYDSTYNEVDDTYRVITNDESDIGINTFYQTDTVHFSTMTSNALKPDTEYKLSVKAYYTSPDGSGIYYQREFISRKFYTDSTGIHLSYKEATENSITVDAVLDKAYADTVKNVKVFLLTEEQNENISDALIQGGGPTDYYVNVELMGRDDFGSGEDLEYEVKFTADQDKELLKSNTKYILRAYVETSTGLSTLTQQEMEVMTLKTPLLTDSQGLVVSNGEPSLSYNRTTGKTTVFYPTFEDKDNGVVSYTYKIYQRKPGDTLYEEYLVKEIPAESAQGAEFNLPSGFEYKVSVSCEFFNNEQSITYEIGESESIRIQGDSMPKVTLEPTNEEYNSYSGTLTITRGSQTRIEVNENKPLTLKLYADSVQTDLSVTIKKADTTYFVNGKDDAMGTITMSPIENNEVVLNLDFKNLYRNTTYTVSVAGWMDLNEGINNNATTSRNIGSATFATKDVITVKANYEAVSSSQAQSAKLAQKLTLKLQSDSSSTTDTRADYAKQQLIGSGNEGTDPCGQVIVTLYYGIGAGKEVIGQSVYTDKEDLEALFGTGYLITDADFTNVKIEAGKSYTLIVSQIADASYQEASLNYVNTFDKIQNATGTTAGVTQPPDLLIEPETGVKATPILNKNATTYGATVNEVLPGDAVIGYALESTYENDQLMATSVTFYAYEYNAFCNAINHYNVNQFLGEGQTPLSTLSPLMTMTQPVSDVTVPKVAVLFGGTKTEDDSKAKYSNGYMVYHAGTAQYTPALAAGMGRGFRYIFCYEVNYTLSSAEGSGNNTDVTQVYPYDHGDFDAFQKLYGGVKAQGVTYGKLYTLNSGMCEAPLILPDFHFYIESSDEGKLSANEIGVNSHTSASGSIDICYTWRDVEYLSNTSDIFSKMVVTSDSDESKLTKISYKTNDVDTPIDSIVVGSGTKTSDGWYKATFKYTHERGNLMHLEPTLNLGEYRIDYSKYLDDTEGESTMSLGPIATDWLWEEQFQLNAYKSAVTLEQDLSNMSDNYFVYFLNGGTAAAELGSRAIAMELTFSVTKEDKTIEKKFLLPVITDSATARPCVRVMTSQLGSEFLGETFTVGKAKLYYDNGSQGWSILEDTENNPYYVIQYMNARGFEDYQGATASGTVVASGALSEGRDANANIMESLRATVNMTDSDEDTKLEFTRASARDLDGYTGTHQYLFPTLGGVDSHSTQDVNVMSKKYVTVKGVSTYNLKFGEDQDTATGELKSLTPTVVYNYLEGTTTAVRFNGLKVNGVKDGTDIYMAIYTSEEAALSLNSDSVKNPLKITVDEDKEIPAEETWVKDLNRNQTYYVALYYEDANNGGQKTLLIDQKTTDKAVYDVRTSEGTSIVVKEMEYMNAGYFTKYLDFKYNISEIYNQAISYDIFSSKAAAESGKAGGGDVMTHGHMEKEGLISGTTVLGREENQIRINLTPSELRSALEPGKTYYLKITSKEGDTEVGSTIKEFTLNNIGSYGALVYVQNASRDSIEFRVTITDSEYSLMGSDSENDNTMYMVRFTYDNGKRLYTKYDDILYSAFEPGQLQRKFVLNRSQLTDNGQNPDEGIQTSKEYKMHIYAAPDDDHDGSITLGDKSYTWEEMFTPVETVTPKTGSRLQHLIDAIWKNSSVGYQYSDNVVKAVEEQMLIAEKVQSTTTEEGWMLNKENIYADRQSPTTVRVYLAESINLIDSVTNEGVFKQIDWQVQGTTEGGSAIKLNGTAKSISGDTLIQMGKSAGNDTYYYEIPANVTSGVYTIVLQLRTKVGSESPDYTLTVKISG